MKTHREKEIPSPPSPPPFPYAIKITVKVDRKMMIFASENIEHVFKEGIFFHIIIMSTVKKMSCNSSHFVNRLNFALIVLINHAVE